MFDAPGVQECTVRAEIARESATSDPQRASLWCWAASLSMIFSEQGHPISQEAIVQQNFGRLVDAPGGPFLQFQARLNRTVYPYDIEGSGTALHFDSPSRNIEIENHEGVNRDTRGSLWFTTKETARRLRDLAQAAVRTCAE